MVRETFDVVIPFATVDGQEYTLLTDNEIAERRVNEDVVRERAMEQTEDDLRRLKLLPASGDVTEMDVVAARLRYAESLSASYVADLQNHMMIEDAAERGEFAITRASYTLTQPTQEELAAARQTATKDDAFDNDLYYSSLARSIFVACTRTDLPASNPFGSLPAAVQVKLGRDAHSRASLGEGQLAFLLRSRRLSSTAAASASTSSDSQ